MGKIDELLACYDKTRVDDTAVFLLMYLLIIIFACFGRWDMADSMTNMLMGGALTWINGPKQQ